MDALRGKFKALEATSGLKLSSSSKNYGGNNSNGGGGRKVMAMTPGVNSDQQNLQF